MQKLESTRPPASGVKLLIEENILDDTMMVKLVKVFENAIQEAEDGVQKEKLEKSVVAIKKLQELEKLSKTQEAQELSQLEGMLNDI